LGLESLEGREVPAGVVTTAVSHGNLIVTGDNSANQITVSQAATGQVTITGTGGTNVDGGTASTRSFTGNLVIKLKGGNDTVSFDLTNPIDLPHDLTVSYGPKDTGTKVTQTTNAGANDLIVGRNVAIAYAAGTVTTTFDNLNVTGNVTVRHGAGDSAFTADSKAAAGVFAHIGGSLSVTNTLGQATNVLADTNVDRNVTFTNGRAVTGAGSTTIANAVNTALANIGGNVRISNASGDSTGGGDRVGDVHVKGNVSLSLGSGAFTATVANVLGAAGTAIDGNLTVTGGIDGADTIALGAGGAAGVALTVGKNLTVRAGTHAATITVDNVSVNGNTNITTGSEADTITIDGAASDEGSTFSGAFVVSTGAGTDTLSINATAGSTATTDFEGKVSVNLGPDSDTLNLAAGGVVNFLAPANVPVVFDGGAGVGDVNTKVVDMANVRGTHPAPVFKHFA
jgi:hypothetical protein